FSRIGADEMRHHVWYRDALAARYAASADKAWCADQIVAAVQHFQMPHGIFHLQEQFFDRESTVIGKLGLLEIKMKVARALSFDAGILRRLASSRPEDRD